jgi:hypothetical protein
MIRAKHISLLHCITYLTVHFYFILKLPEGSSEKGKQDKIFNAKNVFIKFFNCFVPNGVLENTFLFIKTKVVVVN